MIFLIVKESNFESDGERKREKESESQSGISSPVSTHRLTFYPRCDRDVLPWCDCDCDCDWRCLLVIQLCASLSPVSLYLLGVCINEGYFSVIWLNSVVSGINRLLQDCILASKLTS